MSKKNKNKSRKRAQGVHIPNTVRGFITALKKIPLQDIIEQWKRKPNWTLRQNLRQSEEGRQWARETLESDEAMAEVAFVVLSGGWQVELAHTGLVKVPAIVLRQTDVIHVNLSNNAITELPESMSQLEALTELNVSKNELTSLPDIFACFTNLTTLDISGNKLSSLPPSLITHPTLTHLKVGANAFRKAAERDALIDAVFEMPALRSCRGLAGYDQGAPAEVLAEVLQHAPPADRKGLLALLMDDPRIEPDEKKREKRSKGLGQPGWSELSSQRALTLLNGSWERLLMLARGALSRRSEGLPLKAGAHVTVVGNTPRLKRTELKKALAELDIGYSPSITPRTTHVVTGTSPDASKCAVADGQRLTFLSEEEIRGLILDHQRSDRFLQDAHEPRTVTASAAPADDTGEHLLDMLLSLDGGTIGLALDLISSSGLPLVAQTGLFVVAKDAADKKQRATARKLLKRLGSEGAQTALANRSALYSTTHRGEKKTAEALSYYSALTTEIDWMRVARYVHARHGHGLSFFLDNASSEARLNLFREHIKDGVFDYHGLVAPGYRPSYTNPFAYEHYHPRPIPAEIFELTDLVSLDLSYSMFGEVPPAIARLNKLKTLHLQGNLLKDLPRELAKLEALRELSLDNNEFEEVPEVLGEMTGLKTLSLRHNRRQSEPHPLTAGSLKTLTRCKIRWGR